VSDTIAAEEQTFFHIQLVFLGRIRNHRIIHVLSGSVLACR